MTERHVRCCRRPGYISPNTVQFQASAFGAAAQLPGHCEPAGLGTGELSSAPAAARVA